MTITGNCPKGCPSERMAACLVHDADVPEPVLAEKVRQHIAAARAKQWEFVGWSAYAQSTGQPTHGAWRNRATGKTDSFPAGKGPPLTAQPRGD